jgi:hypothetical protein
VSGKSDAANKDPHEAQLRLEKIRFFGTVDCRFYPDAVRTLVTALRTDGSEAVRHEAAQVLSRVSSANPKMIEALDACVSGLEKDGHPAEHSLRVRCAAALALERCLANYLPPANNDGAFRPNGELKRAEASSQAANTSTGVRNINAEIPPEFKLPQKSATTNTLKLATSPNPPNPSRESLVSAWRTLREFNQLLGLDHTHPSGKSSTQVIKNSTGSGIPPVAPSVMAAAQPAAIASGPMYPTTGGRVSSVLSMTAATSIIVVPTAKAEPIVPRALAMETTLPAPLPLPSGLTPVKEASSQEVVAIPVAPATPPHVSPASLTDIVPVAQPAKTVTTTSVTALATQLLYAADPLERHAAIRQLLQHDWHKNPVIVSVLLAGAKTDAVAAVRVDCLRHLASYHMSHPQVLDDLAAMMDDEDPWIRDEAIKALAQLKAKP